MKMKLAAGLMIIGLLLLLGTAGASDCGNITLPQILVQNSIGIVAFIAGAGIAFSEAHTAICDKEDDPDSEEGEKNEKS